MLIRTFGTPQAYREHMRSLAQEPERVEKLVRDVLARVRREGDAAVLAYTQQFDGVALQSLRVPQTEIEQAIAYLDPAIKDVWIQAAENIERFHRRQKEDSHLEFSDDGTLLGWKVTPIDRVGVYIPGGKAVYHSRADRRRPAYRAGVATGTERIAPQGHPRLRRDPGTRRGVCGRRCAGYWCPRLWHRKHPSRL
jgi:histidinol dehydrogenase